MTRRSAVLCIALAALGGCDTAASTTAFSGLTLPPGPYVLVDDHLIERTSGVARIVNSPLRRVDIPNPLVDAAQDGNSTPYFAILREEGRFRLWYNTPLDKLGSDASRLAYLESPDGIGWKRPREVLAGPEGGIRFGASVLRRPSEGDYAIGYYQNGGLRIATSVDGLTWNPLRPKEVIPHNHDIAGITYDPIRKRYIAIVSNFGVREIAGLRLDLRSTRQSVSRNLVDWETPWEVLVPDARDGLHTQFYGMDGFIARGDLMIAMVKVLREDLDADGAARGNLGSRGVGWTSLAWSRDGRTWIRDRAIFLGPDPQAGAWDHAFAWIDEQVEVGDSVYLYYAGYAEGHKNDRARDRQIGMQPIARDRYVAWTAGPEGGVLRTRLLRLTGTGLTFNIDASAGEILVRVLDQEGKEVLGECEALRGDLLEAQLICKRPLSELSEPVRLELRMRTARLFALTITD
jgi:hypothetical protein